MRNNMIQQEQELRTVVHVNNFLVAKILPIANNIFV
jgi:hypothetical protein